MGLTFTVGATDQVFIESYAPNVTAALKTRFSADLPLDSDEQPWYSEEVAWSGWADLQERAIEVLGIENVEHLLSMEAWKGVYLPIQTEAGTLEEIPGDDDPLAYASLPALIGELTRFGNALKLPTDIPGLETLFGKYMEDDDLIDQDMDIQTYSQLLIAALVAEQRKQPLWVVK